MSHIEQVGRYALGDAIARGGMATLHLGRLVGSVGFARTVAIKRLHPHLCVDPSFVQAFADEAKLAARIRHPNVVPMLDVVSTGPSDDAPGELLLVMEYVDGESLSALGRRCLSQGGRVPLSIVVAIVSEMLHGLHAAHEATSEAGDPLGIVHRDVSPQNVLVGADGVARLVDFGIARATGGHAASAKSTTREGDLKGKLAYMAPEQIRREPVTRRTDVFAAGIVLWELLTGARLFASDNEAATLEKILVGWVPPPSSVLSELPPELDEIALRALAADPNDRFDTAREMAVALEDALGRALGRDVAAWVEATAGDTLAQRRARIARAERGGARPPVTRASFTAEMETLKDERAIAESETTVTSFGASDEGALEPTRLLDRGSAPPLRVASARTRGSDRGAAFLIFTLAAVLTVLTGIGLSRYRAEPAPAVASVAHLDSADPGLLVEAPPPPRAVEPSPAAPVVESAPVLAGPAGAPRVAAAILARPPPVKRAARPRPAPRPSCVAKVDPASGKTIYLGSCD